MAITRSIEGIPSYSVFIPPQRTLDAQQQYRNSLAQTAAFYSVPSERLVSSICSASEMMSQLEVAPDLIVNRQKLLIILAVGERLGSVTDHNEYIAMENCVKLLAVDYRPDGSSVTFSNVVQRLSSKNLDEGSLYDPQNQALQDLERRRRMSKFINDHYDHQASQQTARRIAERGPGSLLHTVRTKLGVNPDNENAVKVFVLTATRQDMSREFGLAGMQFNPKNPRAATAIVLGQDYPDRSLEHEYCHSQGSSVWETLGDRVLFRGTIEGLSELLVSTPEKYPAQREALGRLGNGIPDFEFKAFRFYRNRLNGVNNFFRLIIRERGLESLLKIARMSPYDNINSAFGYRIREVGRRVYIPPSEVAA